MAQLTFRHKVAYGVGQAAEGIKNFAFEWFLFFYFNQVLGLRGTTAGAALLIALLFDAITDPMVGSWSDAMTHRWGRRHLLMYLAAVPLGLSFALLFAPPAGLGQVGLFLWLTAGTILVRGFMTLYHVPHMALGAELSDDYQERTAIVGYRILFGVAGALAVAILSWRLFFHGGPGGVDGQLDRDAYPGFGAFYGLLMATAVVVSALGTHSRIPHLAPTRANPLPFGARRVLDEIRGALRNRSFRYLFFGIVIFFVTRGVQRTLGLHMLTYFWRLEQREIEAIQIAMVLGFTVGIPVWAVLSRRLDKKPTLITGIVWFSGLNLLPPVAALLGAWPHRADAGYFPLLAAFLALAAFGGAGGFVAGGSMMADVADEHELTTHRRQEGIFFGALSFAGKTASGLGTQIAGVVMDAIRFPVGAEVRAVPDEIVRSLAIAYGPGIMILAAISLPFLWRYRLNRRRHAEIVQALTARRGAPAEAHRGVDGPAEDRKS
jgi:glycoside/pentoside/hexuronide:cation symporter, GPH family